jgi:hypothetical protein
VRSGTLRFKSGHRERFSAPELMLLFVLRTCTIITGEPKRSFTLGADPLRTSTAHIFEQNFTVRREN